MLLSIRLILDEQATVEREREMSSSKRKRKSTATGGSSKSMLNALRKELEEALERCKDRDRMAEELENLKTQCEDREMLARRLAEIQTTQEEMSFNTKRLEQRLEAADEVKKNLEHRLKQTESALKMKVHAMKQLDKKLQWERRALEGQMNKARDLERRNNRLSAEAKADRDMREETERVLQGSALQVRRERSLRMLSLHKHAKITKRLHDRMKLSESFSERVKILESELQETKNALRIEAQAKSVLETIVASQEAETRRRDEEWHDMKTKLEDLSSRNETLMKRDKLWSSRFDSLRKKFDVLRQKMIERTMKVDPSSRQQSSISRLMDMTSPSKPTFPLGKDWGVLDAKHDEENDRVNISLRPSHRGLKSFMGLTHAFKIRMRGKSLEEIVEIASSDLRNAQNKLKESKDELKRKRAEHESVSIRCDAIRRSLTSMRVKHNKLKERKNIIENDVRDRTEILYELRKQRKSRVDTLRRRRLCEKEEVDPYVLLVL